MPVFNFINSSCSISNDIIYKNGRELFRMSAGTPVPDFLNAAYTAVGLNYPKFYKMDNLSKLGWMASEILLLNTFDTGRYKPEEVGIVMANSHASLDTDLKYFESTRSFASPSLFVYTLPNIVMGEICIRNKFKGENAFFLQESFDPEFLEQYVNQLLNSNILQACICGWVDVLKQDYEACLFLVEKQARDLAANFTAAQLQTLKRKK